MVTKCTVQCPTEGGDRYMGEDFPQICEPSLWSEHEKISQLSTTPKQHVALKHGITGLLAIPYESPQFGLGSLLEQAS